MSAAGGTGASCSGCPSPTAPQMGPNARELFRLVEDFVDVIGFRMKDLRDAYQVTDNLGKRRLLSVLSPTLARPFGSSREVLSGQPPRSLSADWQPRGPEPLPRSLLREQPWPGHPWPSLSLALGATSAPL